MLLNDTLAQFKPFSVLERMAWYGMIWYGMVWYSMVWYGMVWYGMVWCGIINLLTLSNTAIGLVHTF